MLLGECNGKLKYKFVIVHRCFVNPLSCLLCCAPFQTEQFVATTSGWKFQNQKSMRAWSNTEEKINRNKIVFEVPYLGLHDFPRDMWRVIVLNEKKKKSAAKIHREKRNDFIILTAVYKFHWVTYNLGVFPRGFLLGLVVFLHLIFHWGWKHILFANCLFIHS